MSLTVQPLNEDSTFLLTFAPPFAPSDSPRKYPGAFTILVDPWLQGDNVVFHPKFASSRHSAPPTTKSLAELKQHIDVIVISQDKADHLSKETLCSLPKDSTIKILATPKAAKKILSWRHFQDSGIVQVMKPYTASKQDHVIRIPIESYSSTSADGEITVANVSQRRDLANLHNAICVTYCPPGTTPTAQDGTFTDLDSMSSTHSPIETISSSSTRRHYARGRQLERDRFGRHLLPNPTKILEMSPMDSHVRRPSTSGSRAPSISAVMKRRENYENVLSVVYTPHGITSDSLRSYTENHLSHLNCALPVTALFHGLIVERNPWYLGGVVCAGAPGGVKLALDLEAKIWISAHDGAKEVAGWATRKVQSQRYAPAEVGNMLREIEGMGRDRAKGTEVCVMKSGEIRRFP